MLIRTHSLLDSCPINKQSVWRLHRWDSMPTRSTLLEPPQLKSSLSSNHQDRAKPPHSSQTASRTHRQRIDRCSSSSRLRGTLISAGRQPQPTPSPESTRTSHSRGKVARVICRERNANEQAGALPRTLSTLRLMSVHGMMQMRSVLADHRRTPPLWLPLHRNARMQALGATLSAEAAPETPVQVTVPIKRHRSTARQRWMI